MMYRDYYTDQLYHYGVSGMRWGRRKQMVRSGTSRKNQNGFYYRSSTKTRHISKATAVVTSAAVVGGSYIAARYLKKIGPLGVAKLAVTTPVNIGKFAFKYEKRLLLK